MWKQGPAGKIKGQRCLAMLCFCLMIMTSGTDDTELEKIEIFTPPIKISWTNSQYSICRCSTCCKKVANQMKLVNRENTPPDEMTPQMDQEHSSSIKEIYLFVVKDREVKSIAETETVSWHKNIYTYTIKGFMPVLYFFMKTLTSDMRRNQFKNPKISTSTDAAEAGPHRPNWIYILLLCHVFIPAGLYYGIQKEVAHLPDNGLIESAGNPANRNGKMDTLGQHKSSHIPAQGETPSSKLQKETATFSESDPQNVTEPCNPIVSNIIPETKPSDITNAIPPEGCKSLAPTERPFGKNSSTAIRTQVGDHSERNRQRKQEGKVLSQRNNGKQNARCGTVEDRLNSSESTDDEHEHELYKTNKNRPTYEHCNYSEKRSAAEDNHTFASNKYIEDSCHSKRTFDTLDKNGTQHTEETNDKGSTEKPPRNDSIGNTEERSDKTEYHLKTCGNGNAEDPKVNTTKIRVDHARTSDNNHIKDTNGTKNAEEILPTNTASYTQEHSEKYGDRYSADYLEPNETEIKRRHIMKATTSDVCCQTEEIETPASLRETGETKEFPSASEAITNSLERRLKSSESIEDEHEHKLYKTNNKRPTFDHCNASVKRSAAEDNQMFASDKYMEDSCHTRSTFDTFGKNGTQHTEENNDNGSTEKPPRNYSTGNTEERSDKTEYHLKTCGNGNAEDPKVNITKIPVDHARPNDNNHVKNLWETNEIRNTEEILPTNTASNAQEHSKTYGDRYSADWLEPNETEIKRRHIMKATTSEVCCKSEETETRASFRETGETKEFPSASDATDAITNSLERRLTSSESTENEHIHKLYKTNKNRPTYEHCNASEKRSAAEDNQSFASDKYMEDSCHTRSTFDTFDKNGTQHTEENNDNGSTEKTSRNDSIGNIEDPKVNTTKIPVDHAEEIRTAYTASNAQEHSKTYGDGHSADHLEANETEIKWRHITTSEECCKTDEILASVKETGNTKEIPPASDAITNSLEPWGTAKTKSTAEQEQTKQHSNTFDSGNTEKHFRKPNNITETTKDRNDNRNNEILDTQHKVEEISHSSDVAECTDVATRPDDGINGFNRNGIAFDDNFERITIKTSSNTVTKGNYQGYIPCFDNQRTIENPFHDENESEGDDDDDDETMLKTRNATFPSEGDDHLATTFIYQDDEERLESVSLIEDGCARDDADIIFNSSTSSTLNSQSNQTPNEHNVCKEPKNSNGPYVSCCFETDEYIPGKVNKMMPEISSNFVSYTNDHLTTATSASANQKVFKSHGMSVRLAVNRVLKKVITPNIYNASQFRNAQHLDIIRRVREATLITQNLSNLWQHSTAVPGHQHYRDENRTFNRSPRLETISDERETLRAVGVNGGSALPASTDTKASLDVFAAIGVCSVFESMVYEWGRLKTFFNFPMNNPMMPVTLAKYGFYYTGDSDVVKCFSCNVSHGNWQKGDSVYAVHYQTSPRCRFMNGEDKRNVSIHGDVAASVGRRAGGRDDSLARNTDWAEATPRLSTPATVTSLFLDPKSNITPETDTQVSGGPLQTTAQSNSSNLAKPNPADTAKFVPNGPSSNEETRDVDNQSMNQQHPTTLDQRQQMRLEQNGGRQQPLQRQQDQTIVNGAATNFTNTEAAAARPRYPNYSSVTARAGTFNGFPNHLDQTPLVMAKAGFFYAGYGDYVRCFFCGGGLRNWEPGDDPWVEHARWFPRCTHVKQHKGQPFINLVLQRQRELTLPNEYITTREQASNTDRNVTSQTASVQTHNDRQTGASTSQTNARKHTESKSEPKTTANTQNNRTPGPFADRDQSAIQSPDPKHTGSNGTQGPSAGAGNSSRLATKNVEHNSQTAQHLHPEPKLRGRSQDTSYTDEELKSIQEENNQLKEQMKCKICMDNDVCISFLPCGHLCCCAKCAPVMVKCPICRQIIKGSVKTFLS